MSNYKKFDLNTIRTKLKNGEYAGLTGAMRAIGKTQELSESDKDKARAIARKHFGDETPAAAPKAKKASKKVAKKAAAPKAAKAGKKKSSKKAKAKAAAPAAPVAKVAKKTKRAPRAQASAPEVDTTPEPKSVVAAVASKLSPETVASMDRHTVVLEMGQIISTVKDSLLAMEAAKRMFPKASLERNVELSAAVMTRAVQIIDQEVTKPRLGDDAAPSTSTPSRKKASKRGTRGKAATATSKPAEEEAVESVSNGAHTDLSEEEQEQLELARQTQNAASAD